MGRSARPHPYHVTITRWLDSAGRRCQPGDPGARKVRTQSTTYYADLPGRPRVPLKDPETGHTATELGHAWEVLRRLLREHAETQLGIQSPHLAAAVRPIAEHVEAWLQAVRDSGTGLRQLRTLRARVLRVVETAGWQRVTDISEESALRALAQLQQGERGRSAQTRNHYRSHLRQLCTWLVRTKRLLHHPLLGLRAVNVEEDRRLYHRDPSDQDIEKLWAYLLGERARVRSGMSGEQRALGYSVAMATGFRAEEVRSLTPESFDLEAGTVTVEAAYSKHRRRDVQPLPDWLVEDLRRWFAAGGGCWQQLPEAWPGRVLKADVLAAGVVYRIASPQGPLTFTFHSLRVWFISRLASQPDISPAVLFRLARHSDPKLTLGTYAKVRGEQQRAAVEQLAKPAPTAPLPSPPEPTPPADG